MQAGAGLARSCKVTSSPRRSTCWPRPVHCWAGIRTPLQPFRLRWWWGWRSHGSLLASVSAFVLLLWLRFSLIWIGWYFGLLVPNQEAAGNLFAIAFPFGMISCAFTPPSLMPEWLGAIAMWNPVSSTPNAIRKLFGDPVPPAEAGSSRTPCSWPSSSQSSSPSSFCPGRPKYQRLSR
jgi:hypothetical protein